jgi:hypothetical protein
MSTTEEDLIRSLGGLRNDALGSDLSARLLADAALEQARQSRPVPTPLLAARMRRDARSVARGRRWQDRLAWSGLAAAGLVGVMVGLLDPGAMLRGSAADAADYVGGYEFQLAEAE